MPLHAVDVIAAAVYVVVVIVVLSLSVFSCCATIMFGTSCD
jgi:hypothetical protein